MIVIMAFYIAYGLAAVIQLFTSGAKVIDSLPPFWWWGIPLAPYSALYTPWARLPAVQQGAEPPAAPSAPSTPEAPQ